MIKPNRSTSSSSCCNSNSSTSPPASVATLEAAPAPSKIGTAYFPQRGGVKPRKDPSQSCSKAQAALLAALQEALVSCPGYETLVNLEQELSTGWVSSTYGNSGRARLFYNPASQPNPKFSLRQAVDIIAGGIRSSWQRSKLAPPAAPPAAAGAEADGSAADIAAAAAEDAADVSSSPSAADSSSTYLPTPAGMSFLFDISYTTNPRSEADFVHLSSTAVPQQLPAYVWRRLLPGEPCSSADSSNGDGSWSHQRQPWVVVDKSCARLAAAPETDLGYGVFAWRRFRKYEVIGIYCGRVLGKPSAVNQYLEQLPQSGEFDATIVISKHVVSGKHSPYGDVGSNLPTVIAVGSSGGRVLYDRQYVSWPGMFAHLVNDAYGVRGGCYNVQVTEPDGVMQAICDIDDVYFPCATAGANAAAELFWSYGRNFRKGLRESGKQQQQQQGQRKRTRTSKH